ncbi:MAG: ComF family protein [Candidatus Omnitrophica bacterium]|nr:ComF family protein [Candidatus Omnitrophota bacterium]
MLTRIGSLVDSLVFPRCCEICSSVLPVSNAGLCPACESGVRWIRAPHCVTCGRTVREENLRCGECAGESFFFDRAYACVYYEEPVKTLLHLYKFGGRKVLKHYFLGLLRRFIGERFRHMAFDAVAAVPLDKNKERQRGFNQSALLSSRIARDLDLPETTARLRRRGTLAQSLLNKTERKDNVRGCFEIADPAFFRSKKILLIDDILTTGQTASECARALKDAGAAWVTALACARGV